MHSNNETGKVFLVGAGPGAPDLITVKGVDCIARADVVIYDYLASPALLAHANPDAEMIYVGKKGGDHTLPQDGINALIVEKAKQGNVVARLKGGDPFIFGRGGEEVEVLVAAGIPFEVVPGVTAAIGASAYAGIPLTHRDYTSDVAFVTGHEDPTKAESSVDWKALATGIGTLVFFMGVKNLPTIAANLVANGRSTDTPVAVIRWGTTPKQKTVIGTLGTIVDDTQKAGIKAPAIIIIGGVVNLRKTMQWFENRPLMGRRIVVTRAREQASNLILQLTEYGAECIQCPMRALGHIKTATIGPATADRLLTCGLKSDIIPESYRAESVVEALAATPVKGSKILMPRAKEARSVLPVELTRMGAIVDEMTAYETRQVENDAEDLIARLAARTIDMVTFTSSSTVKNFHRLLPPDRVNELMEDVTVASIGPITSRTARNLGLAVTIEAELYTVPGLVRAILNSQA
ncbi:MAG: uroporphyrinogen-III C-methyltransferase [Desulfosarcina sp.]|nr:uroporphyrinogen-III C-methyltransferase [Desulfosarcina sp.]MBC2766877.1 uroporphyrinogen-III C-methyltransferase [Desulfosarcina sp.]